jgi:hypothetical protein
MQTQNSMLRLKMSDWLLVNKFLTNKYMNKLNI